MRLIIEGFLVVRLFGCLVVCLSVCLSVLAGAGGGWLAVVVFFASLRVFRSWSFHSVFSCRLVVCGRVHPSGSV